MNGMIVRNHRLGVSLIVQDASTRNQAKAAFRKVLFKMGIPKSAIGRNMKGIEIIPYNNASCATHIKVGVKK
jgi:hypothetical protein